MARRTKRENEQIIYTYYGINAETYEVESVSQTRGGSLTAFRGDNYICLPIGPGCIAKSEVVILFKLQGVFCVPAGFADSESTKMKISELQAKADAMKKSADTQP